MFNGLAKKQYVESLKQRELWEGSEFSTKYYYCVCFAIGIIFML